jgi:Predicted ATPase involved in cell division
MLLKQPIGHNKFDQAVSLAHTYALNAPPGTLIFCVGPSGAGKSTLRAHIYRSMYGERERWKEAQIPIVSVSADNPEHGFFSSKDLFSRLLASIADPFRGNREDIASTGEADIADKKLNEFLREPFWKTIRVGMTEPQLRRTFVRQALDRGLKAILIDEAQLMCLTHRHRSPTDYLESLKCLAEELGVLIFFFGTYALLEVWNHSAQLNRRMRLIHMSRYLEDIEEDRKEFYRILKQVGKTLPLASPDMFLKNARFLFQQTWGVFGELDGLLERSRDLAQAMKATNMTFDHVIQSCHTGAQARRLADEITDGEARVRGDVPKDRHVQQSKADKSTKKGRMPGRRNPIRDACGSQR